MDSHLIIYAVESTAAECKPQRKHCTEMYEWVTYRRWIAYRQKRRGSPVKRDERPSKGAGQAGVLNVTGEHVAPEI